VQGIQGKGAKSIPATLRLKFFSALFLRYIYIFSPAHLEHPAHHIENTEVIWSRG
jgi:hypothetical protein